MNAAKQEPPVKPGDIIAGKYRVERILGVGGMGYVIAATHLELLELRALKFMLPTALPDAEAVERFLREARAASRLKSEHVARVHDVGRLADGTLYMVMEHLEGTDLGAALKRSGVPPVEEAIIYILQVLEALAEAHSVGIVHRDLKPANLFLTHRRDGTPCIKVLDFGISKVTGAASGELDVTKTHAVLGSPQYMSPEQMHSSRDVDARSDIWSLGVIIYQLLTGHVPFRGKSITELVAQVMLSVITPPSQLSSQVPPALDAVVLRCLERDVNARYTNVAELSIGLRPFAVESAGFLVDRVIRTVAAAAPSSSGLAAPSSPGASAFATPLVGPSPYGPTAAGAPALTPQHFTPQHFPLQNAPPSLAPASQPSALIPLPALSASGAWGGTAAGSPFGRPGRSRATLIIVSAVAAGLGAIVALSLAGSRGPAPITAADPELGRVAISLSAAIALRPPTDTGTGAGTGTDTDTGAGTDTDTGTVTGTGTAAGTATGTPTATAPATAKPTTKSSNAASASTAPKNPSATPSAWTANDLPSLSPPRNREIMPSAARRLITAALAAFAVYSATALASAAGGSEKEAQTYFVDGMKLMGKKRYAEACENFAKSQELDPGMGTQYRLAECYEKLGRLASAYEQFNAVADAATEAKKPDRALLAKKRAAALETRVAKLTIDVPPSVASLKGVEVRRDGKTVDARLWGTPIPVDSGDHIVTVTAPKKKPWEGKVWAEGTSKLLVSVAALEDVAKPAAPKPTPRSKVPPILLGAAAGVGIVIGATFVGLRASEIGNANDLHDKIRANEGNCIGGGEADFISDCRALASSTSAGDTFGTTAVVGFVVGGAAAAAMVTYLLLPAPEPARASAASIRISPVVGAGQGGLVATGTF